MGVINSARICGNVHRKNSRKGMFTFINWFCLDLVSLPLVSPLDLSLLCQMKERAEQKHKGEPATWTFQK